MLRITFQNPMVKVIEDHSKHSSLSIFSEIGGSLGLLLGFSCIGIVEYIQKFHKIIFRRSFMKEKGRIMPANPDVELSVIDE